MNLEKITETSYGILSKIQGDNINRDTHLISLLMYAHVLADSQGIDISDKLIESRNALDLALEYDNDHIGAMVMFVDNEYS